MLRRVLGVKVDNHSGLGDMNEELAGELMRPSAPTFSPPFGRDSTCSIPALMASAISLSRPVA